MTCKNPDSNILKKILTNSKTIAIVGLSPDPQRTSNQIAVTMQKQGYRIIPVNPTIGRILGEKSYEKLQDIPEHIDIINVFRRPDYLPSLAQDALETDSPVFWAQQGIYNEEACETLQANGRTVVMDLCIKVMHSTLIGNK